MSNAQRRRAAHGRRRVALPSPARVLAQRLHQLDRTRRQLLDEERRAEQAARPIPTSGPGRRRAKATRNAWAVCEGDYYRWKPSDPNDPYYRYVRA